MGKFIKIVSVLILIISLILIRVFENNLFYDPFMFYFKHSSSETLLPKFEIIKLLFHVLFRYVLNAIFSLSILYVVFKNRSILKFSVLFYSIAFVVLSIFFVLLISNLSMDSTLLFFYIRRFLIQPIFILLLLPAFYYQQLMKGK